MALVFAPGIHHRQPLRDWGELWAVSPINPAADVSGKQLAAAQQARIDGAETGWQLAQGDGRPNVVLVVVNPPGVDAFFVDFAHAVKQVELVIGEVGEFFEVLAVWHRFGVHEISL